MILSKFSEIIRQISKINWINSKVFSPIHVIYIGVLDILQWSWDCYFMYNFDKSVILYNHLWL